MAECNGNNPCLFCLRYDSDRKECAIPGGVDLSYICSTFSDDLNYDEFVHYFMGDNHDKLL